MRCKMMRWLMMRCKRILKRVRVIFSKHLPL